MSTRQEKIFVFGMVCLLICPTIFGYQEEAINSFEVIVAKIDKFLSSTPVALVSQPFEASSSGTINYLLRFEKLVLVYDVKKSDSLISPYIGYIAIGLRVQTNAPFGDIVKHEGDPSPRDYMWGFEHAEDAKKIREFSKCVDDPNYEEIEWCCGDIQLIYAYQKKEWIFTGINTETDQRIKTGTVRWAINKIINENPEWKNAMSKK